MLHIFLIDYGNTGEYYWLGIEGELESVEKALKEFSRNVRYSHSRKRYDSDKGKRILTKDCFIRSCAFAYSLRPIWVENPHKRKLSVDDRHTVIDHE